MISALITLIVYVVILALLWWLVNYVLDNFPIPEPANRLIRVAVVVLIVIIVVFLILGLFGVGGIENVPRIRIGWLRPLLSGG